MRRGRGRLWQRRLVHALEVVLAHTQVDAIARRYDQSRRAGYSASWLKSRPLWTTRKSSLSCRSLTVPSFSPSAS